MAAMHKKMRIAVTALSLTACVLLLIELWVRSYWGKPAVIERAIRTGESKAKVEQFLEAMKIGHSWDAENREILAMERDLSSGAFGEADRDFAFPRRRRWVGHRRLRRRHRLVLGATGTAIRSRLVASAMLKHLRIAVTAVAMVIRDGFGVEY
jgi:hypothetical protein